jgi:hypothetical protein
MIAEPSTRLVAGDRVRLLVATHPKGPVVGSIGIVVLGDEQGETLTTVVVAFGLGGKRGDPTGVYEVLRRHLQPAAAEVSA